MQELIRDLKLLPESCNPLVRRDNKKIVTYNETYKDLPILGKFASQNLKVFIVHKVMY